MIGIIGSFSRSTNSCLAFNQAIDLTAGYGSLTNSNFLFSIHILADIVYWYRPTEHRFNISKKQAYDAVVALENLGLSEKDALTIVKASGNDISKCKTAKSILCQQTQKIQNVFGWLIRAVTENYQSVSKKPAAKKEFLP